MIVKTNFPDYLMHYGRSINDGAPGVGTGNWRRGGAVRVEGRRDPEGGFRNVYISRDGSVHSTAIGAHIKNGTNRVKKAFARVKAVNTQWNHDHGIYSKIELEDLAANQNYLNERKKAANDKPLTASDQELAVGDENSVREYKRYESNHPGMSSYDHTSDDGLTHLTVFSKYNASKKEETMPSRNELEKANETFDKAVKNKDEIKKAIIDSIDDRGYLKEWAKDKNDNPLSRQEIEKSLKQFYASVDPNDDMNTVTVDFSIPNGDFDWLGGHGFTAEVYFDKDGKPKVYYPRIEG